jgi:hypothetical protein
VRQSAGAVHAFEQSMPLPVARMSAQTAPAGHASPEQL